MKMFNKCNQQAQLQTEQYQASAQRIMIYMYKYIGRNEKEKTVFQPKSELVTLSCGQNAEAILL